MKLFFYFTPAFILAMENADLQTQERTKENEGEEKPILIKKKSNDPSNPSSREHAPGSN